jgi:hypothetical protein
MGARVRVEVRGRTRTSDEYHNRGILRSVISITDVTSR